MASRTFSEGEIVHVGWFALRITNSSKPVELECPDFRGLGTFTSDLREAETIFEMQANELRIRSLVDEPCTMRHTAVVSKSYVPGHPHAFLKRDTNARNWDSGWYLGILNDPLNIDDSNSFLAPSLYELSIADRRMLPYWLMPVGTIVSLEKGVLE